LLQPAGISLYVNLAPDRVVRRPPVALSVFNSMRHRELAARQGLIDGLSKAQRSGLQRDLDEVEASSARRNWLLPAAWWSSSLGKS
jgi:hypothetical protein